MPTKKSLLVVLVTLIHSWQGYCESQDKSSLVFVIDDTGSMANDIDQVATQGDSIFESAITNSSNTEDFVIVTFNDPDRIINDYPGSKHLTTTKDKDEIKKVLANMTVDGGGDCPELAMEGLELALQKSRRGSLVYLFTDADAKDFNKYEVVKNLAKQKKCRLHFILTGTCQENEFDNTKSYNEPGHKVFYDLAEATGGQVFSSYKDEVAAILNHARVFIGRGYATVVASDFIPRSEASEAKIPATARFGGSGSGGSMHSRVASASYPSFLPGDSSTPVLDEVAADNAIESPSSTVPPGVTLEPYRFNNTEGVTELLVSISGFRPSVEFTAPDGTAPKTEDVVTTSGLKVIKILDAKPGEYTAKITSLGRTSIVISGTIDDSAIMNKKIKSHKENVM